MNIAQVLSKSETRVSKLHPVVAQKARQLIIAAYSEGINIVVVQGLRTMEEQAALYAQGRTTSGIIVTNAKAGYSYHNYGLALDYAILADDGNTVLWTVNGKWIRVAEIGKGLGFAWGGDWTGTLIDYPHLEMTFGFSINDLLSGKRPSNDEVLNMRNEDVDFILAIMGKYWHDMDGNVDVQNETHRVANLLRVAMGRKEE